MEASLLCEFGPTLVGGPCHDSVSSTPVAPVNADSLSFPGIGIRHLSWSASAGTPARRRADTGHSAKCSVWRESRVICVLVKGGHAGVAMVTMVRAIRRNVRLTRTNTTFLDLVMCVFFAGVLNGGMKRTARQPDSSRVSPVVVEDGRSRSTGRSFGGSPPPLIVVVLGLAAVAAVVGLAIVRPGDGGEQEDPLPPVGAVILDGPELVWSRVDLPEGDGFTVTFADGGYLAVERVGGFMDLADVQARVWQSDDGHQWEELTPAPFPAGTTLVAVTAYEGVVVAAGVTFHPDSNVTPGVWSWSTESGWDKSLLPEPELGVGEVAFPADLVAGPAGFVLTTTSGSTLGPGQVIAPTLPPEVAAALDAGAFLEWGLSSVEVSGPGHITFFRASFEELGVDPTVFATIDDPPSILRWWSPDGQIWELVDRQFPFRFPEVVTATDDGFVAEGWISKDGTTWTPNDPNPARETMQVMGKWGDRFVALDSSLRRFWVSDDALQWRQFGPDSTSALFSENSWLDRGAAGAFGILTVEMEFYPPRPDAEQPPTIEKDGLIITMGGPGPPIVVRERDTGAEVLSVLSKGERTQQQVRYDFNAQTMTLTDPETGHQVVTLTFAEIQAAERAAYQAEEPKTHLLFTADGQKWSSQATDTQLGGYIQSMAVGQHEAVVATTSPDGTTTLWIGTLNP